MELGQEVVPVVENSTPVAEPTPAPAEFTPTLESSESDVSREDWNKVSPTLRKQVQNNPEPEATEPEAKEPPPPAEANPEPEVTKVKIGDEELTLEQIQELKKGSMLQADYTRKTQELANQRKQIEEEAARIAKYKDQPVDDAMTLWEQLSMDPVGTIRYLEQHYSEQGITEPEDPEILKAKLELVKEKQKSATLEQEVTNKKLEEGKKIFDEYMVSLSEKYKDHGFDTESVLTYCRENGISNPEVGFKAMMFDPAVSTLQQQMEFVRLEAENQKKSAVTDYVKDKVVKAANYNTPVGSGISGSGFSVEKPKTMKAAKQAAMQRMRNS